MPFALVLDVLIAVLLVATIGYAISLNRKLGQLRKDRSDLEDLAKSFNDATERAQNSIRQLGGSARDVKADLKETLAHAEALKDDLVFLIDRAGGAADKLEEDVRTQRTQQAAAPAQARPAAGAAPQAGSGMKIKDTVKLGEKPRPQKQAPPSQPVEPAEPAAAPAELSEPAFDEGDFKPKSDAERELLKALQSVR